MIGGLFQPTFVVIFFIIVALVAFAYWKIVSKAGYSGWLGLLILIPLVNVAFILVLALMEWPIERRSKWPKTLLACRELVSLPS